MADRDKLEDISMVDWDKLDNRADRNKLKKKKGFICTKN